MKGQTSGEGDGSDVSGGPAEWAEAVPLGYDDPELVDFEINDGLLVVNLDYEPLTGTLDWDFDQPLVIASFPGGLTLDTKAQYHFVDVTVTAHRQPPQPLGTEWLVDERELASPDGLLMMSSVDSDHTAWSLPEKGNWHVRVAARGLSHLRTIEETIDGDRAEFLVDLWK